MTTTGFKSSTGADLGTRYIDKDYVLDWYPELLPNVRSPALWAWGYNISGQIGDNTAIYRSSPVQTVAGGTDWQQVACGGYHAAAIKLDGSLWLWGSNVFGQLGDITTSNRSSPIQTVAGGNNWKQVSVCYGNTAAIKTDGSLWVWGDNTYGQLGNNTTTDSSSPVQTVVGGTSWQQVSCSASALVAQGHTAAIKNDGSLWLWGHNAMGQLGDNSRTDKSSPIQTVAGGTTWKQVACGYGHTAAIKTDGSLWVWGINDYGQLGDNTSTGKSSPIQTIAGGNNWKQVACGKAITAAVKTDGTLWLWGAGQAGMLGGGTYAGKSSPVQTIYGGTTWHQVACGYSHVAAIKTDGTLWLWGYNRYGELGDTTVNTTAIPIQTVTGGTNWTQVSCGWEFTAAVAEIQGW